MIAAIAAALAFAAMLVVAGVHAGHASWIQGLNYIAAGFPLAMAIIQRSKGQARGRRLARYYLGMALFVTAYGWYDVEKHKAELAMRERTVEWLMRDGNLTDPVKGAGLTVTPDEISFRHSIGRRHVLDRKSGVWRDEAA